MHCGVAQNKITKDASLQQKMTKLAKQALERAEALKGIDAQVAALPNPPSPPTTPLPFSDTQSELDSISEQNTDQVSPTRGK